MGASCVKLIVVLKFGHCSNVTALFNNIGDSVGLSVTHFCGSVNMNLLYYAAE